MTMDRRLWLRAVALGSVSLAGACHRESATETLPQDRGRTPPASTPKAPLAASPVSSPEGTQAPRAAGELEVSPDPLAKIYIQPLGEELPLEDVEFVMQALGVFFPHPVVRREPVALPEAAYYPPRSRYRAEKLLEFLEALTPADAQVVMALTDVDISTTKGQYEDWGILGLATVAGRQCVISRFRAKRGASGEMHTRMRLAKVVVHEVGHTLGLEHCPNVGCLMEDGQGTVNTTDREYDLCPTCRAKVGNAVRPSDESAIPWARPG